MKIKVLLLSVFVAGIVVSYALAGPPPGKGHGNGKGGAATTAAAGATTTTTTTATLPTSGKVLLCHKTGQASHWVRISVSAHAAPKRIAKGDVWLQDPAGTCAGAAATHGNHDGSTTTDVTTTAATTTAATTTDVTTTAATTTAATTTTTP